MSSSARKKMTDRWMPAERYEWLRAKVIKDGSRRKYKKSNVLTFIEHLQKSA